MCELHSKHLNAKEENAKRSRLLLLLFPGILSEFFVCLSNSFALQLYLVLLSPNCL